MTGIRKWPIEPFVVKGSLMRHVIIGNGIAGVHAIEVIRRLNPEASVTLIADETFPPYCRPVISLVLEGAVPADHLPIRDPDFYETFRVEPLIGQIARGIDVENREVLVGREGRVPFDRLLIATGANPRPIRAYGLDLKNIFFMRTQAHVKGMLEALPGAKRALVLGGGLVGFKAAYGLLHRGLKVTMLIRSGHPLSMQVDSFAGKMVLEELQKKGLEVRVGTEVAAFEGNGKVTEVCLDDGTRMPCDMAVIGKGVRPATFFVPQDRIRVDTGILVDDHLETDVPGIFAAGDVAEHFDVARKTRWVNAIWPVAAEQGRVAGMNMAGRNVTYKGSLSRNVIRIFDMDVLTGGWVNPPQEGDYEALSRYDPHKKVYRKLVFRGDRLVGLAMVNEIEQGGVLLSLIHQEIPVRIPKERLLEPGFNFAQLLPR